MRKTLTETETIASEKRPPFPTNIYGVADPQANNHELGMKKKNRTDFLPAYIFSKNTVANKSRNNARSD
jgi:hypothetical protein